MNYLRTVLVIALVAFLCIGNVDAVCPAKSSQTNSTAHSENISVAWNQTFANASPGMAIMLSALMTQRQTQLYEAKNNTTTSSAGCSKSCKARSCNLQQGVVSKFALKQSHPTIFQGVKR